jgi:DNA-directed RNA polymerase subunit RPC12/RpoP
MMPRDKNEQIDILYFEEKLLKNKSESIFLNSQNYKIEKKFGVKKPTPLSSEQIYYFNNFGVRKKLISNGIEIVNRKDTFYVRGKSFTISKKPTNIDNNSNGKNNGENLDNNDDELFSDTNNERKTMSFHNNNNNMDMGMKSKEELRMSQKFKSTQPLFTYYIFPKLNNDYFYQSDIKNYYLDFSIYQEVKNIDNELLSKSHLSRVEIKTNEATNYIHLIWLKMWVSTFYYQDKQEQKYRFLQMLNILDKINQHEMGVINNLFTVLVNNQIDEDLLLLLYDKILHYQLIPSNFIFKTIRKLINNKKNKLKLKTFNISKYLSSISDQLTKDLKEIKKLKKNFRKRTMRSIYDTQILDEKISFLVEENCSECDKKITMYQLIKNLNEINNDLLWAKCPYCGYNYLPKLKVKFGTENNKNNRLKLTTSIVDDVILYSPKTLNYNMFDNTKTNININLEEFKSNYNPFFWNIIWYFKMKKLPFDFILPYEDNILHYLINNKQKIIDEKNADEDLNKKKESLFFKMNFCNYVKKAKEELRNKKKNFYNKNELIMCINEIDVYIPPRSAFSSRHASFNDRNDFILRSNTNTSRISDYHSVINVNDFQNTSQLNLERDSFGSQKHINSVKKNYNIYINNEISVNNTFNSSISIIKIKPNRKRSGNDYISDSTKGIGYLNKSNNKNKMSYSLHYKNNDKLKPLDINDSNLMDKQLKNSYQNTIPNSNLGDYQY